MKKAFGHKKPKCWAAFKSFSMDSVQVHILLHIRIKVNVSTKRERYCKMSFWKASQSVKDFMGCQIQPHNTTGTHVLSSRRRERDKNGRFWGVAQGHTQGRWGFLMAKLKLHLIFVETPSACQRAKPCTAVLAPWTCPPVSYALE